MPALFNSTVATRFRNHLAQKLRLNVNELFFSLMKAPAKAKGKAKNVPFDPIFFAATVPARQATGKDLKDVSDHENDPIEPKGHNTMDDTVEDL